MDEQLLAFLGTLVEVRSELGEGVYEAAIERARVAVAHEVLVEAERRAIRGRRSMVTHGHAPGVVIAFPGNPGHA
ncbi:hypothetical protein AIGOOFII_4245 [Methylobacterium marchantiae]|nr:hypothetical protein AIGOOFII_4245 [Methylobacterium marchantiae]